MLNRNLTAPLINHERAVGDGGTEWYEHAWKYPLAVVGDLAQTVVNSGIAAYNFVAPESIEVEEIDKYAFMSNDLEEYTREHRSAVTAGSFMAGVVIPGLGISKGMALARTGQGAWGYALGGFQKGINAAKQRAAVAAVESGWKSTDAVSAMRAAKFWTAGEAVAENALFEASIYGLMSQHDYFEEGWNPYIGLAGVGIGASIGGWLKWARVSGEISAAAQSAEEGLISGIRTALPGHYTNNTLFDSASASLSIDHGMGTVLEAEKRTLTELKGARETLQHDANQQGKTIAQAHGGRLPVLLDHVALATEGRVHNALTAIASKELAATLEPAASPTAKMWELVPETNAAGHATGKMIRPSKMRMTANYLMGQADQAIGVVKAEAKLLSSPVEAMHGPWKVLPNGLVEVKPTKQLFDLLDHGTGGRIARDDITKAVTGSYVSVKAGGTIKGGRYTLVSYGTDPLGTPIATLQDFKGTTYTVPRDEVIGAMSAPKNVGALDKLAKGSRYDPRTGIMHVNLSAFKGIDDALAYMAYRMDKHGAHTTHIDFGSGRNKLDTLYRRAAKSAGVAVSKQLASAHQTAAAAKKALPDFLDTYQTLSWWDGRMVAQDSIEAHMTMRAGHALKGSVERLPIALERRNIADSVAAQQPKYVSPYIPVQTYQVSNRVEAISAQKADTMFMQAFYALKHEADPTGVGGFKFTSLPVYASDVPRLQAAYLLAAPVTGLADRAAVGAAMRTAKVEATRQFVRAFPELTPMEVSIRTNLPLDTVNLLRQQLDQDIDTAADLLISQHVRSVDDEAWMVYRGAKDYAEAAKEPSVSITGRAQHTMDGAAIAAKLDRESAVGMEMHIVDTVSEAYKANPLLRAIHEDLIRSADASAIRAQLEDLVSMAAMGTTGASADFTLRRFRDLVGPLTAQGGKLSHLANEAIKAFERDIDGVAKAVVDSPAATTQFEYVRNALAGLGPKDAAKLSQGGLTFDGDRILLFPATKATKLKPAAPASYLKDSAGKEIVVLPEVKAFFQQLEGHSEGLWKIREATAKIRGKDISFGRRGLWLPSPSLDHTMQAFVYNTSERKVIRLIGRDMESFNQGVAKYRAENSAAIEAGKLEVHLRSESDLGTWLRLRGLAELEGTTTALPTLKRAGIAVSKVTGSSQAVREVINDFKSQFQSVSRQYLLAGNSDIFRALDNLEAFQLATRKAGPAGSKLLGLQNRVAPATAAKATMLNLSLMQHSPAVAAIDDWFSYVVDKATLVVRQSKQQLDAKLARGDYSEKAFAEYSAALNRAGVTVPFRDAYEFAIARTPEFKSEAKTLVAQYNGVVATLALRLMDAAHPIVTTLTAPIVMHGELVGAGKQSYLAAMKDVYDVGKDWMRQAISPQAYPELRAILEEGKRLGHTQARVSEATEALGVGFGTRNWWQKLQAAKVGDVPVFEWMCKASDFSEHATREMAYIAGYKLAKRTMPGVHPSMWHTHAALFTNRAMGNYLSRQRPVFFQGAAGQAIGLFQTFIYTMGQNLFRYAENQQLRAVSGMMGGYVGMFGLSSLPGFESMDAAIGAYSNSPDDEDITQTIYHAFGDKVKGHSRTMAEYMLYGAPSTLLQTSLYTRGELNPRLPTNSGGLPWPPALGMVVDGLEAVMGIGKKTATLWSAQGNSANSAGDLATAIGEGIAQQYIWRPAARMSELALGYTLDQKGQTIVSGDDVRGPWAGLARVLSARPLKEQVIRNQSFRSRYYDSADQRRRKTLIEGMRTRLRQGGDITGFMGSYINEQGGSLQGWRQALNELYLTEQAPGAQALLRRVQDQPGIGNIMEGYTF